MNTDLVQAAATATVAGTKSFPEIVGMLFEAVVEYYHVDYVTLRKNFYSAAGVAVTAPLTREGLPPPLRRISTRGHSGRTSWTASGTGRITGISAVVRCRRARKSTSSFCAANASRISAGKAINTPNGFPAQARAARANDLTAETRR